MDQLIGRRLDGRYELLNLVGSGGMAQVYRAHDLATHRIVAVKVLKEQFLDNEEIVQRFKNESRAISMMDHPNIVRVYDVSVWDKTQFLVMELIEGQDLKRFMDANGGKLTWKETVHFAEETLYALQHAHEHGIIHRDVKPQNIMLLRDGSIKVMDFGIARFFRSGVQTSTDKAMGSVHYISPEQAKGEQTDARSDLYSVGVMMYEMLTGQLPFNGDSNVAVAIKQISEAPKPLREIDPNIPEGLEAIVLRAMQKAPEDRYASAQQMLEDISKFKENPSIQFAYRYIQETPTRYIDVVKDNRKQSEAVPEGRSERGKTAQPKSGSSAKNKKKKGFSHYALPVLAGMAFAFLFGSVLLVYMIFHFSGNTLFEKRADVDLPNFVGMNVEQVLHDKEYNSQFVFSVQEAYRSDYGYGYIYDQSPKGNKNVKEGHEIILRVSKGVQIVTVPNVVGYVKEEVVEELSAMGLSVLVRYEVDGSVPLGQVIKTEPIAGTQLSSGQQITVFVSAEKIDNTRRVPSLIGVTSLEDAKKLLSQSTLALGTATGVESELPEGTIIEQSVDPGTSVYAGTAIHVSYSLGYVTRVFKITVRVIPKEGTEILNGQTVSYSGESYVTQGGGKMQNFTFEVSTTAPEAQVEINGKSITVSSDVAVEVFVKSANRPDGCTCPEGANHDKSFKKCALNKSASSDVPDSSDSSSSSDSSDSSDVSSEEPSDDSEER